MGSPIYRKLSVHGTSPITLRVLPAAHAEGREKLRATWQELAKLKPRFFSCTYGAGGSTREGTLDTVLEIIRGGHQAAPHISCVASTKRDIAEQLERYKAAGIRHLVALRGDLPSGIAASGEFRYRPSAARQSTCCPRPVTAWC